MHSVFYLLKGSGNIVILEQKMETAILGFKGFRV